MPAAALDLLRPGVLAGVRFAVAAPVPGAGPPGDAVAGRAGAPPFGAAVADRAAALGAAVRRLAAVDPAGAEAELGGPVDVLAWDGSASPAPGGDGIRAALDGAWLAVRPVGVAGEPARILLLAPAPGDAAAEAVRAGLENLARTLSIEWARLGIRPVAILPGNATGPAEVAELAAFLASPAGEYYSGCAFTLGSGSAR